MKFVYQKSSITFILRIKLLFLVVQRPYKIAFNIYRIIDTINWAILRRSGKEFTVCKMQFFFKRVTELIEMEKELTITSIKVHRFVIKSIQYYD